MSAAPKTITLALALEDVGAILSVLGELPSKTGVWPLIERIREQAEPQAKAPPSPLGAQPGADAPPVNDP